jgi:hypothetical protein
MNSLVIAAAGGSAGAILTLVAGVPGAIRNHDRLVAQTDADLAQWVADECVQLERELEGHKNEAGPQLYSGSYLRGVAHLKAGALHRYRDEDRAAQQRVGEWRDAEGFLHWLVRRFWTFSAFPGLGTPEKVAPILDGWREDVSEGSIAAPVSDPTRRSLDWAIGKYGSDAKAWDRFLPGREGS